MRGSEDKSSAFFIGMAMCMFPARNTYAVLLNAE